MENLIKYKDFRLRYKVYGDAKKIALAFHGHTRMMEDYSSFAEILNRKIIAVEMFHHGESFYRKDNFVKKPISKKELTAVINEILLKENVNNFDLIGYSLGGKFALNCLAFFNKRVDSVILLAADGMRKRDLYSMISKVKLMRVVFKWTIDHPNFVIRTSKFLRRIRLISTNLSKFAIFYFEDKDRRELAYVTWASFRNLYPNHKEISSALEKGKIEVSIVNGKYDKVIKPKFAKGFMNRNAKSDFSYTEIKSTHDFFSEKNLNKLHDALLD